jgi:hypothetical protein
MESFYLRPQRRINHSNTATHTNLKPRQRIQIATNNSNDDSADDMLRNEYLMRDLCRVWESSLMNGEPYTPPWIRVPEELHVHRRQRMISHPIEVTPIQTQQLESDKSNIENQDVIINEDENEIM